MPILRTMAIQRNYCLNVLPFVDFGVWLCNTCFRVVNPRKDALTKAFPLLFSANS